MACLKRYSMTPSKILRIITKQFQNCDFLCAAENCEKFVFMSVRKTFEKVNSKSQT